MRTLGRRAVLGAPALLALAGCRTTLPPLAPLAPVPSEQQLRWHELAPAEFR